MSPARDADAYDDGEPTQQAEAETPAAVGQQPQASAAIFGCPGDKIALRASNGDFVGAVDDLAVDISRRDFGGSRRT